MVWLASLAGPGFRQDGPELAGILLILRIAGRISLPIRRDDTQGCDRLGPEKAIGHAVAVTSNGQPEHLGEYVAEKFGLVPGNPLVPRIADSYAALDGLAGSAGSSRPPTEADELAAAERKGDSGASLAIKFGQLGRMLRPN